MSRPEAVHRSGVVLWPVTCECSPHRILFSTRNSPIQNQVDVLRKAVNQSIDFRWAGASAVPSVLHYMCLLTSFSLKLLAAGKVCQSDMAKWDLFDEELPELTSQFMDGNLLRHLSSLGLDKGESLELFVRVATTVSDVECEVNPDGLLRIATWKRIYSDKASFFKTVLCLPLLFLGWIRTYHKEQVFVTQHRMDPQPLRGYYLRRFASTLMQVLCGVLVAAALLVVVFLVSYYCVESVQTWEYLYLIAAICVIGLGAKGYGVSKSFGIPVPLRIYSANGTFEFMGLKKLS